MFYIRSAALSDLPDLYELANLVTLINLPADRDKLHKMIDQSQRSFIKPDARLENNYYIFVLEDTTVKKVIGVSLIHALHGTKEEPHFFLKVGQEHKYSQSINIGFVHGTLKLGIEGEGYTEIGGLVLHPNYRNNGERLGKQISFARFLYMANHSDRFRDTIHSELMPPLDEDGNSFLWEAIGRKFMNMDYYEADALSRQNKEFILSLFPSENIYQTLLSNEARLAIGKVGKDTEPVKKMLESIGFKYMNEVDPFDGGPHYRALLKDIKPIKERYETKIVIKDQETTTRKEILLQIETKEHAFCCVKVKADFENEKLIVSKKIADFFKLNDTKTYKAIPL
jgi:arginine N-succinyltransferase